MINKLILTGIIILTVLGLLECKWESYYNPPQYLSKAIKPFAKSVCKGKVVDTYFTGRDRYFYITCANKDDTVNKTKHNFNEITFEFLEGI